MIDEHSGWAIADDQGGYVLVRTTDGGRHWKYASSGSSDENIRGNPIDLATLRKSDVWVTREETVNPATLITVKLVTWHTADNGRHWSRWETGVADPLAYLQFADSRHGFMLSEREDHMAREEKIYRTSDGGRTWKASSAEFDVPPATLAHPRGDLRTGMTFRDAKNGWLGVSPYPYTINDAMVYHTVDAGRTWHRQAIPLPARYRKSNYYCQTYPPEFFNGGRNGIVALQINRTNWSDKALFAVSTTIDGGATWGQARIVARVPFGLLWNESAWPSFTKDGHGWVIGLKGNHLYCTSDGGRTWHRIKLSRSLEGMTNTQYDFVDSRTGWALITHMSADAEPSFELLETRGGGRHWRKVYSGVGAL